MLSFGRVPFVGDSFYDTTTRRVALVFCMKACLLSLTLPINCQILCSYGVVVSAWSKIRSMLKMPPLINVGRRKLSLTCPLQSPLHHIRCLHLHHRSLNAHYSGHRYPFLYIGRPVLKAAVKCYKPADGLLRDIADGVPGGIAVRFASLR